MYQVILVNDETENINYYYSYTESDDTTLGNISVDELPPYQDILKARACYYHNESWIFDEEKYTRNVAEAEAEAERKKEEKAKTEASLSNEDIAEALMELADIMAGIDERLSVLEGV